MGYDPHLAQTIALNWAGSYAQYKETGPTLFIITVAALVTGGVTRWCLGGTVMDVVKAMKGPFDSLAKTLVDINNKLSFADGSDLDMFATKHVSKNVTQIVQGVNSVLGRADNILAEIAKTREGIGSVVESLSLKNAVTNSASIIKSTGEYLTSTVNRALQSTQNHDVVGAINRAFGSYNSADRERIQHLYEAGNGQIVFDRPEDEDYVLINRVIGRVLSAEASPVSSNDGGMGQPAAGGSAGSAFEAHMPLLDAALTVFTPLCYGLILIVIALFIWLCFRHTFIYWYYIYIIPYKIMKNSEKKNKLFFIG